MSTRSAFDERRDPTRGGAVLQQFAEHVAQCVAGLVAGFEADLQARERQRALRGGVPLRLVGVESRSPPSGQRRVVAEGDRVEQAGVDGRAAGAEDVRGVAGEEDPALAVALAPAGCSRRRSWRHRRS